jgi:bacteriophage N4 adsorption protein B
MNLLSTLMTELGFFSGVGIFLVGLEELLVDVLWALTSLCASRRKMVTLMPFNSQKRLVVFVAAWQEEAVIGSMLRHAVAQWGEGPWCLYVGCYPNDRETIDTVAAVSHPSIRMALNVRPGPTTKGDCLNTIWAQMLVDEARDGLRYEAIILHDAEDMVHPLELDVIRRGLDTFAVVQLPVLPAVDHASRWVSGHYIDEFSEAHSRDMVVRSAIGASLPMAGVGCAIRRDAIDKMAALRDGLPFAEDSLTEDYELGLTLGDLEFSSTFIAAREPETNRLIAVRAHFPAVMEAAIRQKTRWTVGIALLGWRKLGWSPKPVDLWMRVRDRRTVFSSLIMMTAYAGLLIGLGWQFTAPLHGHDFPTLGPVITQLWAINFVLLIWRAAVRAFCVSRNYALTEAMRAIPRMLVSSFIAIASSRRALVAYIAFLRHKTLTWDKTDHVFPAASVNS